MKALILNCTLKASPETSNTEALARVLMGEWAKDGIDCELVRLVDLDIKPGVKSDEGDGDAWPGVRAKIAACDILVIATPTWLGQMSSVAKRALERMDAFFSEMDDQGHTLAMGKVAGVVVTGNEDGAHHIVGTVSQALIDVGFTVPGQSWTYWHLGPGPGPDYTETAQAHDYSDKVGRNAARNLAWAARALAASPAPRQEA
ncbi:flavodoxin family protein [Phenylobacterium soli]|uniref:Flavodoxin family protein n=1 Tax=Phenylobacterium soli TaxID=2170551 RepID=A0A328ALE8_9CAUL|nr:NAD(P)H-dependent oxidoreductase [Phenylobacterium soli]RAK55670.1 flavodoxin family protein [Phenylobacterium soli]